MTDKVLNHKGYVGSIEMSIDDNCLYGKVLHVNDLVNYEGKTPEELQRAFIESVDFYLQKCKENGLDPDKPFSGSFNVRLSSDLHRSACIEATRKGISLNELVKTAVENIVAIEKVVVTENHLHTHTHIQHVTVSNEEQFFEKQSQIWQPQEKLQ